MKRFSFRFAYISLAFIGLYIYTQLFLNNGIALGCSFYQKTNLLCPGCGGQRALSSIFQGEFKQALILNPLIFVYMAVLGYLYITLVEVYVLKNTDFQIKYSISNSMSYGFIALMVVFFIVRNITCF